jgi:hypothetical protein
VPSDATPLERALIESLLAFVLILEDLPDDEIDPDTAVRLLEGIASTVQEMDAESRVRFAAIGHDVADAWDGDEWHHPDRLRMALASLGLGKTSI